MFGSIRRIRWRLKAHTSRLCVLDKRTDELYENIGHTSEGVDKRIIAAEGRIAIVEGEGKGDKRHVVKVLKRHRSEQGAKSLEVVRRRTELQAGITEKADTEPINLVPGDGKKLPELPEYLLTIRYTDDINREQATMRRETNPAATGDNHAHVRPV